MPPQLPLKLALAPLLLGQALWTRRRLPRLPEAAGPRQGTAGQGELGLTLLILGDSSAAGVGVAHQRAALAGQLSRALAQRLQRRVPWQLCARSGVTTAQALDLVGEARPADVAVVVTGVNDVIDQVSPQRALRQREALVQALRQHAGVRQVVMTPVPPMGRFAGLPQPLRWLAGQEAAAHEAALRRWAGQQPAVSHLPFELPVGDAGLLASDGFHPGAPLYAAWGRALAQHIADAVLPRL
ncbi:MAG: SGNH/GDSL hydrolase family protein [Burkholderiaceae bacterium]|nr:SGNH/GDSL hydrolase family protein [Burkholderiaceae bacterium]